MSTSITNGYNFGNQDVFSLSRTFREVFRPVLFEAIHSRPIASVVEMYDKLQSKNQNLIQEVHKKAQELDINSESLTWLDLYRVAVMKDEKNTFWDPQHEHNLEIVFLQDEETKNLFAMVYGNREARAHFNDLYSEFEYFYWNNTDRPDEIAKDEWKKRKLTWDRLLGYRSPKVSGLSTCMLESYEITPRLAYYEEGGTFKLPTIESRVRALASILVAADFSDPPQNKDEPYSMAPFMEHMSSERITAKKNLIEGTIVDTLDIDSMRSALERPWVKGAQKASE